MLLLQYCWDDSLMDLYIISQLVSCCPFHSRFLSIQIRSINTTTNCVILLFSNSSNGIVLSCPSRSITQLVRLRCAKTSILICHGDYNRIYMLIGHSMKICCIDSTALLYIAQVRSMLGMKLHSLSLVNKQFWRIFHNSNWCHPWSSIYVTNQLAPV